MSTTESAKTLAGRPWPNGDPATWVYLDDLPTPPEVVAQVEQERRQYGWWWRWWWRKEIAQATREWKRMHYFPGKQLLYKRTPRGWLILMAAAPYAPEVERVRESMSREERRTVSIDYVCDPSDETSRLSSFYELREGPG